MSKLAEYQAFLEAKFKLAPAQGFFVEQSAINPMLKPHQRDIVQWALDKGRAAIFASFGLGKSFMQLEISRLILAQHEGSRALIVMPLGVRQEFKRDADKLGISLAFIRRTEEVAGPGFYITNYESVRDSKLDTSLFISVSLDEAAILRGFGGSKTFRELMRVFEGTRYRFVATATPSPNEYIEILAYSAFLGVMEVGEGKTRFFKRDSSNADKLTIHPHKVKEFWIWCASWSIFLMKPSDLGYDDTGYTMPAMEVHWHEVASDHTKAGQDREGQGRMFRNAAIGVSDAASEKRSSMAARIEKMMELRLIDPEAHRIIWHDLEDERRAIEKAIPDVHSVYGSLALDNREAEIIGFSDGEFRELAAKPSVAGSGCNFQRHCSWSIFLGIGFKFHDLIQAIHRIQRFGQERTVRLDFIYTEAERDVKISLEAKWARHNEMMAEMQRLIKEHGLSNISLQDSLRRTMGVTRQEVTGKSFRLINNDCIPEVMDMPENSVDLIITSIPFATQYEYTPTYNDFGHTDDNAHFWEQMDFLSPELLRILKPGRNACIHVKDRIIPGGLSGLGFQTLNPFHAEAIFHHQKHGFAFLGMKTITTDVVRENNQTYRLGWSEQCKDGTRMGCGVPEYLLLFRKPPSDATSGYADVPVVKEKPYCTNDAGEVMPFDKRDNWKRPKPGTGYSRAAWQLDAHAYSRTSGDRLLTPDELRHMPHDQMYKRWEAFSKGVYDYRTHLAICELLDEKGRLPATFMLFPPHSPDDNVWTDITRMRTLNGEQHAKGREMHLCPLQIEIVERCITQMSMPGETVFDPFAGIGTVPVYAAKMGRFGLGTELSASYFHDAVLFLKASEAEVEMPTLFDFLECAD